MAYGENETLGIYIGLLDDKKLLGIIRNRLEYNSIIPVHRQVWDIRIGRIRVTCDSLDDAMRTETIIMRRLGLTGITYGEIDWSVPRFKEVSRMVPKSDYEVGQRLVLTIPVKYDVLANKTECIAAECEILEVRSIGSKGWWLRIKYDGGEFAAIESMDGQLEVQTPVESEALAHDGQGGLEGCITLHTAIRGVR